MDSIGVSRLEEGNDNTRQGGKYPGSSSKLTISALDSIGEHADMNSFLFLAMILVPYHAGLLCFMVVLTKALGAAYFDEFPFNVVFPVMYFTVTIGLAITMFRVSNRTKKNVLRTSMGFHTISFIAVVCMSMWNKSVIDVCLGTVALVGFVCMQVCNVGQLKIS